METANTKYLKYDYSLLCNLWLHNFTQNTAILQLHDIIYSI